MYKYNCIITQVMNLFHSLAMSMAQAHHLVDGLGAVGIAFGTNIVGFIIGTNLLLRGRRRFGSPQWGLDLPLPR